MESNRQKKVARLVQKDLSQIFLQDSRVHYGSIMVSVTHVLITKDLSQAKVYLSLYPKRLDIFEEKRFDVTFDSLNQKRLHQNCN